ncbi:hypothetical protein ACWJKU_17070 [Methylocaldum sp. MU1018]
MHALLAELGIAALPAHFAECALVLPGHENAPLACPELAPYLDIENPEQAEFTEWTIACCRLAEHPIGHLNEIHFQSIFRVQEWLLGGDFLFWHWFTQSLKAVLFKDSFIPSLRLRETKKEVYELYAGWEFLAEFYENLIREAAERMPPSAGPGYEAESLLRHCAEVLLHRSMGWTQSTQALAKKIQGSLVEIGLRGDVRNPWQKTKDLTLYRGGSTGGEDWPANRGKPAFNSVFNCTKPAMPIPTAGGSNFARRRAGIFRCSWPSKTIGR